MAWQPCRCFASYLGKSALVQTALTVFLNVILGVNVLWTLGYPAPLPVQKVNNTTGVILTVALILHCVSLHRRGIPLAEVFETNGERKTARVLYFRTPPLSWIVCYTVWNVLFAGACMGVPVALQDILLWCLMVQLYYDSDQARPIEDYFGHVRPIQLAMWILGTTFMGQIPNFKDVEPIPALFDSPPFYLFLSGVNLGYGILVLVWTLIGLIQTDRPLRKFDSRNSGVLPIGTEEQEKTLVA